MPLTYKSAKEILSKYAERGGVCADDRRVDLFVREVLDYLLISGHYGSIHKFCFCATRGCFTVPYELETPLKLKIDNEIGNVWDKWYEFHASKVLEACVPAGRALWEDPNYYPTVYDVPVGGARIGTLGTCEEREDAYIIVKGKDLTGREIITMHKGEQVVGEYLSIKKQEIRYTQNTFGQITDIVKTPTAGYVQLLWVRPTANTKGFLADYTPLEEAPQYRRFRITIPGCPAIAKVSVLGRIRLREKYADNDYIPFDNLYALNLAGQAVNANYNNAPDLAKAKDDMLTTVIEKDNQHHRIQNGQPIEVYPLTSAGAIRNIIGG